MRDKKYLQNGGGGWESIFTISIYLKIDINTYSVQFSRSVVSDSMWPPWTTARQASLSITNSRSLLKLMPIESVMPSNHLILCRPLLLPPSIFPSIRVFSNESVLCIRWPKYSSFNCSISPSNEYSGLMKTSFRHAQEWNLCRPLASITWLSVVQWVTIQGFFILTGDRAMFN